MRAGSIILGLALLPVGQIRSALPDLPHGETQLQIRAGYYTDNGKYLGGIPEMDSEYELFRCTEFNHFYYYSDNATTAAGSSDDTGTARNGTTCVGWAANEINSDEYKQDTCSCRTMDTSGSFCRVWTCSRVEIDRAILLEKEIQITRCTCTGESDLRLFCASWGCFTTGLHGDRQYEELQCITASLDADYCEAWAGEVQSSEEVRVSRCACVEQLEGAGDCLYWECEERGLDICSHGGLGWCNLGVSLGVGGVFGSLGALLAAWAIFRLLHRARHPSHRRKYGCYVLLGFFWMSAWSIGVVVWGGVDGAMYAGIWWGGLIVIDLLYGCCTNCS